MSAYDPITTLDCIGEAAQALAGCSHRSQHEQKPGRVRACTKCIQRAYVALADALRAAGRPVPRQTTSADYLIVSNGGHSVDGGHLQAKAMERAAEYAAYWQMRVHVYDCRNGARTEIATIDPTKPV